MLSEAQHVTDKLIQQRIERDLQHLKGRTRPVRGFKTTRGRALCVEVTVSCASRAPASTGWAGRSRAWHTARRPA
jgi:transposase-like protein